ncbi:MAG: hypothetical protein PHC34_13150 [Candidatus Gastranaerophilales bacterium]|nr:hypothetical protein [Candidatus Gastranaerophilales bacterium]
MNIDIKNAENTLHQEEIKENAKKTNPVEEDPKVKFLTLRRKMLFGQ